MPTWLNDRTFMPYAPGPALWTRGGLGGSRPLDVVRHAKRLRDDRQARVDRGRRRKERRVDDEQIVHVVRAAERIEHRRPRIAAEHERAALMRRVARRVRVRHHLPESEPVQDSRRFLHESCMRPQVVRSILRAGCGRRCRSSRDCRRAADPRTSPASPRRATPTHRRPRAGCHHRHAEVPSRVADDLRHDAMRAALRLNLAQRIGASGPAGRNR